MTTGQEGSAPPEEFVGYGPAAKYLGLETDTLSSYCSKGIGPKPFERRQRKQYLLWVFSRAELDRWRASRDGQGRRNDLLTKTSPGS